MRSARTLLSTFLVSAKKWTPARLCNSRLSHTLATDTLALWDHLLDILLTLQPTAALDLNLCHVKTVATLASHPKEVAAEPTMSSLLNTMTRQTVLPRKISMALSTDNTALPTIIMDLAALSDVAA